jgi:phospholipid/cholesterol/gamma-HCH transport system substrate-binding protein
VRRPRGGGFRALAGDPLLVGAVTLLAAVVAVYLSYNAHRGLPFVPVYKVEADLPDGENLVPGNDVRIGGRRVGLIDAIDPVRTTGGRYVARVHMRLTRDVEPLGAGTTALVRYRSALGLKYLQLTPGRAGASIPDGGRLRLAQAKPVSVDLDDVLAVFDAPTRRAVQRDVTVLGDGLAGRGDALNAVIARLPDTLASAQPALRTLAAPSSGLRRFIAGARALAGALAPVAGATAGLVADLDATFAALADPSLPAAVEGVPPLLEGADADLPPIRTLAVDLAGLAAGLRPGLRSLRATAPVLASTLERAVPALRRTPGLAGDLDDTLDALGAFARDDATGPGLDRLAGTLAAARPLLGALAPAQSVCNYGSLAGRNLASSLSDRTALGSWLQFIIIVAPTGPGNEAGPAAAPADGPSAENRLHANPLPAVSASECEAGNEPYAAGRTVIGSPPSAEGTSTELTRRAAP